MNREKILVVDDDTEITALCRKRLEIDGYETYGAATGKQALDLLNKKSYNLVILDLKLPDINGMEILGIIKTNYQYSDVIIMTGAGSEELRRKAIQSGAYDYIHKPFSHDELKLLVKHCLEKQKLLGEVKQYQEKLIQSEKMASMAKVTAYIAHELRKPLANIKTFSQFCLTSKTISLDERARERIEIILRNCEKASKIIDDILAISRPIKISLKVGSINEVIEKICQAFESEINSQIRIIRKFSTKLPCLKFDYDHIERAFGNIIMNSLQAMSQRGKLTVETVFNPEEKKVIVSFIDTGCGISDEEIGLIFDPFFARRKGGIGIGLSFAKEIIELHHGDILAKSKKGEGTAITVNLPLEE
ncbi:MAG: response regulator [Elusimicrobia bacterium]|nr:response regulator [Elusimicrobiota bacterium]